LAVSISKTSSGDLTRSRAFKTIDKSKKKEGGLEKTAMAEKPPVEVVVRYAEKDILMSGWAKGEDKYLKNKAAMMDVTLGEGHVILFGFKPQFRGQPRASYKLLFNAILSGGAN